MIWESFLPLCLILAKATIIRYCFVWSMPNALPQTHIELAVGPIGLPGRDRRVEQKMRLGSWPLSHCGEVPLHLDFLGQNPIWFRLCFTPALSSSKVFCCVIVGFLSFFFPPQTQDTGLLESWLRLFKTSGDMKTVWTK